MTAVGMSIFGSLYWKNIILAPCGGTRKHSCSFTSECMSIQKLWQLMYIPVVSVTLRWVSLPTQSLVLWVFGLQFSEFKCDLVWPKSTLVLLASKTANYIYIPNWSLHCQAWQQVCAIQWNTNNAKKETSNFITWILVCVRANNLKNIVLWVATVWSVSYY